MFEIEVEYHDKLILDVYDENRMTRDDFPGRAEIDTSTATTSNCSRIIGKRWRALYPRRSPPPLSHCRVGEEKF